MKKFQRPSPSLVDRCRGFSAATLGDAMDRTGCMDSGLKPLIPDVRICGPAVTVRCHPGDNLMCHYGLHLAQAGDVLVVDGSGYREGALWGGLLSASAHQRGLAGTVLDGAARDLEDLREIGYGVFARAVTPRGVFKTRKGEINLPVTCGGLTVHPGDLVVGDENGIAVVPRARIEAVIEQARQVVSREESMAAGIRQGQTLYEILGLDSHFRNDGP